MAVDDCSPHITTHPNRNREATVDRPELNQLANQQHIPRIHTKPKTPPMDRIAAAVALYTGAGDDLKVFLAHRSPLLRFFGDYLAFPGGVRDREDGPDLDGDDSTALRSCAERELFEETGVLLDSGMQSLTVSQRETLRRDLTNRDGSDAGAWQSARNRATGDAGLRSICRVRTPPFAPVRYDTAFYLAELPPGESAEIWPGELIHGEFLRPNDALEQWTLGKKLIVPPVILLLQMLQEGDLDSFVEAATELAAGYRAGKLHRVYFSPGILMASLTTPTLPPATTTNCLIVGTDRLFIVDPGAPDEAEQARLFELLDELQAEGASLDSVLSTHHHPDHVGAIVSLSKRYNLQVRGHPKTLSRLPDGYRPGPPIEDGDIVALGRAPDGSEGWHLEAVFTPGHDRGHLAFRESQYGALIAGDMLSTVATILIDPPEGHMRTYMASLERLEKLTVTTLYPAHGPAAPNGRELIRRFITHRERRHKAVASALAKGPNTISGLLPEVYWDVDREMHQYAARSLLAALEMLEEDGEAIREGENWRLSQ